MFAATFFTARSLNSRRLRQLALFQTGSLPCVAWAKGGYLPTHNPNYRQPQGKDPVWNNANCRNRRLFNDRAVKKVAANTKPFLLQTYRRDMGGGNFVLMKDVSSPIIIRGRHWGAFRMGFRLS